MTIHPFSPSGVLASCDYDQDTMGGRLSLARDAAQLPIEMIAAKLGISAHIWSHWENDRDAPPDDYLDFIASALGVTRSWLITGRGDGPEETSL